MLGQKLKNQAKKAEYKEIAAVIKLVTEGIEEGMRSPFFLPYYPANKTRDVAFSAPVQVALKQWATREGLSITWGKLSTHWYIEVSYAF